MEFHKLHALGNDFLVVRAGEDPSRRLGPLARALCERRTGAGADGVIFYQATERDSEADYSALIFNADGSRAEISGNGIRCLAAMLVHCDLHPASPVRVRTVSGVRTLRLIGRRGAELHFQCTMGAPSFDPARIPATLPAAGPGPVLDFAMEVQGEPVRVSLSSMGNPHCSTYWDTVENAPVERLGRLLETHHAFPRRTNVEFIEIVDRNRLRVRFWERGVGITPASGSGSCAAAAVSILRGLIASPVTVETASGSLEIEWNGDSDVLLSGPAVCVYAGSFSALPEGGEET